MKGDIHLKFVRVALSTVLIVIFIISFLIFKPSILDGSVNEIAETIAMTIAGIYCAFEIVKAIDFDKIFVSGNKISLFCLSCCLAFYSLKGCTFGVTKNPFSQFVFPISAMFISVLSLLKIWIIPKISKAQKARYILTGSLNKNE